LDGGRRALSSSLRTAFKHDLNFCREISAEHPRPKQIQKLRHPGAEASPSICSCDATNTNRAAVAQVGAARPLQALNTTHSITTQLFLNQPKQLKIISVIVNL